MAMRINLYNGLCKRPIVCVRAAECLDKDSIVEYHKETSPIIIFNQINQAPRLSNFCLCSTELRMKFLLLINVKSQQLLAF